MTGLPSHAVLLVIVDDADDHTTMFAVDANMIQVTELMTHDTGMCYELPRIPMVTYESINAARCWCCGRGD